MSIENAKKPKGEGRAGRAGADFARRCLPLPAVARRCLPLHAAARRSDVGRRFRLASPGSWTIVSREPLRGMSISGLVVEYIVAIDVTRVRFPADALFECRILVL